MYANSFSIQDFLSFFLFLKNSLRYKSMKYYRKYINCFIRMCEYWINQIKTTRFCEPMYKKIYRELPQLFGQANDPIILRFLSFPICAMHIYAWLWLKLIYRKAFAGWKKMTQNHLFRGSELPETFCEMFRP